MCWDPMFNGISYQLCELLSRFCRTSNGWVFPNLTSMFFCYLKPEINHPSSPPKKGTSWNPSVPIDSFGLLKNGGSAASDPLNDWLDIAGHWSFRPLQRQVSCFFWCKGWVSFSKRKHPGATMRFLKKSAIFLLGGEYFVISFKSIWNMSTFQVTFP